MLGAPGKRTLMDLLPKSLFHFHPPLMGDRFAMKAKCAGWYFQVYAPGLKE